MDKTYFKVISFITILSVLIALISACSNNSENSSSSDSSSENQVNPEETAYDPGFTPMDFEEYEFRILANDHESLTWAFTTMSVEEETGEPILDAVYLRNQYIQETYNVKIQEIKGAFGTVDDIACTSIYAGTDDFDVIIEDNRNLYALIQEKCLKDLTNYPYLDFTKPWWDENSIHDLAVANKVFLAAGDMSLAHYDSTCGIVFNKRLIEDYGLTDPYSLVKNNEWTLENFEVLMKSVSQDIDGDGKCTQDDRYGFTSLSFVHFPAFLYGAGVQPVTMNSDGFPELNMTSEKFANVYEKIVSMFHTDNYTYDTIIHNTDHRLPEYMFKDGKALFWVQLLYWTTELRDMTDDFGILPFPKYNSEQERYYSMVFGAPVICIPVTNSNDDRTGMLIEAMCAESRRELIPAYYDRTMKMKISRDKETIEMLDIIFTSRAYNITDVYLSFLSDGIVSRYEKGDTGIASYIAEVSVKVETEIQNIIETFESIDN